FIRLFQKRRATGGARKAGSGVADLTGARHNRHASLVIITFLSGGIRLSRSLQEIFELFDPASEFGDQRGEIAHLSGGGELLDQPVEIPDGLISAVSGDDRRAGDLPRFTQGRGAHYYHLFIAGAAPQFKLADEKPQPLKFRPGAARFEARPMLADDAVKLIERQRRGPRILFRERAFEADGGIVVEIL